jgi:aminoglycoside/choline kinase family phosphotransferase
MNSNRPLELAAFLDQAGWGDAQAEPVSAGFSSRRYARLHRSDGRTAILMDADANQKTQEFVMIAALLRGLKINAPEIFDADVEHGLVLMEDFGGRHVGDLIDAGAPKEQFYFRATDILVSLHRDLHLETVTSLALPSYAPSVLAVQAGFFLDAYFPYVMKREAAEEERDAFAAAWKAVMHPLEGMQKVLVLRDFMANNLMDLPNGAIGVLDFQDAGLGCAAYDIASLCEETRRDGGGAMMSDIVSYYLSKQSNPLPHKELLRACVIMSAQRHTRFMNTIVLMATRKGYREALNYLPRIRRHLKNILQDPYLLPVRRWMEFFEGELL